MHVDDQLREVILHRIEKGTATISSLAWAAHLSMSHVSNFVRGHRDLSTDSLERLMRAVGFEAQIFPAQPGPPKPLPRPGKRARRRDPRRLASVSPEAKSAESAKDHKRP